MQSQTVYGFRETFKIPSSDNVSMKIRMLCLTTFKTHKAVTVVLGKTTGLL